MIGSSESPPYRHGRGRASTLPTRPASPPRTSTPRWLRRCALGMSGVFAWSVLAAVPVQAYAHPAPVVRREGIRLLHPAEMLQMVGRQDVAPQQHAISVSPDAGGTYPWEASAGGTNTGNGNKTTTLPIVSWTQRGGLPVGVTLVHNSQSSHNGELGSKWTFSDDIYLVASGGGTSGGGPATLGGGGGTPSPGGGSGTTSAGDMTIHWGDDLSYAFANNGQNVFAPPIGIYDSLVQNVDGSYTLTTKARVSYHFNTSLYCDRITDPNGNTETISHNAGNFVTSLVDATGRTLTLGYDASNRITSVTDPLNRTWTLAYDASNNLSQINEPLLAGQQVGQNYHTTLGYDAGHDITSLTSAAGRTSQLSYNNDGSLAWEQDALGNRSTYSYQNGQTVITDANSHVVTYHYANGRLSGTADAQNHSVNYTYDASNNKTAVQDARGKTSSLTYDNQGDILTVTDPLGNVTTYTYNAHGKPLTVTDALNHAVTNTYDAADNLLTTSDALGHVTTQTYDANGLLAATTDALNHTVAMGYDGDGNATSVTDANNNTATFTYNGLGWKTASTDALNHSTNTSYDAWGRVVSVTTPAGTASVGYDADSDKTSATDANGHTTTTTYDADARPLVVTSPNGDTFTYSYDAAGQKGLLSSTTDGNGHNIAYTYDSLDRKSSVAYPDGTSESWTYDAASHALSHTDGKGQTIGYAYDDADKLTTETYPGNSGAGGGISYTYDVAGRKTGMTDVTGTTGYVYDAANRLTSLQQPNGTTGYGYDNANRRTSMTAGGVTGSWTYGYDNANRPTTTTNPYGETAANSYDAASRLTSTTNGNASVSSYGYDNAGRTTDVWHKTGAGTTLAHYGYAYNASGDVTSRVDSDGTTTTFGYDVSDQLTSEARAGGYSVAYTYDHNHNRLSKTTNGATEQYTYDAHDKLLTAGAKTYAYDLDGNCTSVSVGSSVTRLSYDVENRVVGITYPNNATNSFAYNGEDLRVAKTDSTGTKNYVTDGASPASAVLSDGAAVYTPGLSERRGGASKFYHADALGSTRGITDAGQNVTDTQAYDAFGNTVSRTGTTPTPFGFVGAGQYQTDGDSGLQLLGHRYYDPSVGRFLSSDPAKAGTNWYAYCDNDPLGKTDPTGLDGGYGNQVANFLWGEVRGFIDEVVGGGPPLALPGHPAPTNPLAPKPVSGGGSEAQNDGFQFGHLLGAVFLIARGFVGEGGCFVAGTRVQMADGTTKAIEQIRAGDQVLSLDPLEYKREEGKRKDCAASAASQGKAQAKSVVRVFVHHEKTLTLRLNSGEEITTTAQHPFYVQDKGFVRAGLLAIGNAIVPRAGPALKITGFRYTGKTETVYNFEVRDFHTYFVGKTEGGLWVHNDCGSPAPDEPAPGGSPVFGPHPPGVPAPGGPAAYGPNPRPTPSPTNPDPRLPGEPNSVVTYVSGEVPVQSTIYGNEGWAIGHVDHSQHGSAPPGHGHILGPGTPVGHGPGAIHIAPGDLPRGWGDLP